MPVVSCLALLQLWEESSGFFVLARENSTPTGRVRFIKLGNTCPYTLKLDCTSALFCFCTFHTSLFSFLNHFCSWLFLRLLHGCALLYCLPEWRGVEGWSRMWKKRAGPYLKADIWSVSVGFHLWSCVGFCLGVVPWEISAQTRCS